MKAAICTACGPPEVLQVREIEKPSPGRDEVLIRICATAVTASDFLGEDYTAYSVLHKPGLPRGYPLRDMADDYAVVTREEFGGPVDVIDISTGGSIAQPFAADHPDLVITIEAEDQFNFRDRLAEITAPTLLAAGERDPFYTPALFRETAAGIPNARLILYPNMGHPAGGKQFQRDVLPFLREGR